jgi:hypothetical protein
VREVQPSHVRLKTWLIKEAGDQLSKKLAGKDVSEEQLCHVFLKSCTKEVSSKGNEVREVQPNQVRRIAVADEVLIAGKEVSEEQFPHE